MRYSYNKTMINHIRISRLIRLFIALKLYVYALRVVVQFSFEKKTENKNLNERSMRQTFAVQSEEFIHLFVIIWRIQSMKKKREYKPRLFTNWMWLIFPCRRMRFGLYSYISIVEIIKWQSSLHLKQYWESFQRKKSIKI